jgi:hypothetical protein
MCPAIGVHAEQWPGIFFLWNSPEQSAARLLYRLRALRAA